MCSARLHCHRWWRCLASRNLKIARQQKTRQWTRALGREKGATSALQFSFHPLSPKKVSQKVLKKGQWTRAFGREKEATSAVFIQHPKKKVSQKNVKKGVKKAVD